MSTEQQLIFLQKDFIEAISQIDEHAVPNFGKMNLHQMVEHMSYSFEVAYGKILVPAITPEDKVPSAQKWLMGEAMFKPNIHNVLLPDEPQPVQTATVKDAIEVLGNSIKNFIAFYADDKDKQIQNAFYGKLNFEQQAQLLFKHATHHLAQFSK
jgi:Protein of unknown function (DUF1569)